jgi:hypothetical protein
MTIDKQAVAEIKLLYHANELTLAEIGARYGRSASTISRMARRYGWVMRTALMGHAPRFSAPAAAKACELLVRRLCEVINMKLQQMEAQLRNGDLSTEDFERDAKSVASMVGSVSKVIAAGADGEKEKTPDPVEPPPAEVERIHREIVERLEGIQRRREAEQRSS